MKKIFGMLFGIICVIFFFAGQVNAYDNGKEWHKRHMNDQRDTIADMRLKRVGMGVEAYIPNDLKGRDGVAEFCDDKGNDVSEPRYAAGQCHVYHSRSTNTSWKILFSKSGHSARVFKIQQGENVPWAFFDNQNLPYAKYTSPEAQKFAKANGSTDTEVGGSTDPTESNEGQSPQTNSSDILKKGLGDILKKRFSF